MTGPYVGMLAGGAGARPQCYEGENHLLTVGPPGSGKSLGLIVPNLALLDRSMLVIDPKGELARITARHRRKFGRVVIFNPFGEQTAKRPDLKSDGFNPLAALDPASPHFVDDATAIAEGLVKIQGHDPHWSESAQDFVAALLMHLRCEHGPKATLALFRKKLGEPRGQRGGPENKSVLGLDLTIGEMIASDYEPIMNKASRFKRDTNEMSSIISTALSQTKFLDSLPISKDLKGEGGFDFSQLRRETVTVYLILPARELHTHANWLRMIVAAALRTLTRVLDEQGRPPVMLILDEFAQLGHMSTIENAMSLARGYGIQLWPFLQDLTQLKHLYGELWENFLGTAGVQTYYAPRTLSTAEYVSRRCGTHEVAKETTNTDMRTGHKSVSRGLADEPLFQPHQLFGLGRAKIICFREYAAGHMLLETPLFTDKRLTWCQSLDP